MELLLSISISLVPVLFSVFLLTFLLLLLLSRSLTSSSLLQLPSSSFLRQRAAAPATSSSLSSSVYALQYNCIDAPENGGSLTGDIAPIYTRCVFFFFSGRCCGGQRGYLAKEDFCCELYVYMGRAFARPYVRECVRARRVTSLVLPSRHMVSEWERERT